MIFADLNLARRLEASEAAFGCRFVESRSRLSPETKAEWISLAGAYAMFDGPSSPITQTFGLGLFAEPAAADLDRLEAFFRERGAAVSHEVSPLAGVPVASELTRRGYRPIEFTSVMYKELAGLFNPGEAREAGPRTRVIAGGEEELWAQLSARGWGEYPQFTEYLTGFGRMVGSTAGTLCFFAQIDETPVATAVLCCDSGVALLAGASTVPEGRRQGAQRALLEARLSFAASRGCDLAMMCAQSGSASQRNAERQGFRIAYTRVKWQLA